ncbi:MAG: radical SAM protein [Thermodesulfobacteriota bacterium]|nr:radical SAM protein [Thermodesulfobacteriota bacterium]
MKIKLINPAQLDAEGQVVKINREFVSGLTLPYVAALIPGGHDISIIEESVERIDFDDPVDLVGLTAISCRAPRAYWIADQYKKRGVPVIMGGFHATALPEEALSHCDAVVKGEAEGVISQVIEDAVNGRMKGIYEQKAPHPLEGLPTPRYDLINRKNFFMPANPVQATRGCPYHCDFCSVSPFFGSRHRKRPVADVLADMAAAGPYLVIVDDNLMIDRTYALELFAAMKPLNKVWIGQVDVRSAADGELMKAAADAGCRMLYLGIETLDNVSLARTGKTPNLHTDAQAALMQIKRHHIDAFVSMIIGFDNDTVATARQIVEFCNRMRVPILFLYILTPIPGSPMFERMQRNGTPLKPGWHLYDGMHSVFDTPSLKSADLETLYMSIQKKIYTMPSILRRNFFPPHLFLLFLNLWARKNVHSGLHPWMGNTRWRRQLDIIPLLEPLTKPWIRKISRLLRFTEGRFTS